jgi:hypothetical protein
VRRNQREIRDRFFLFVAIAAASRFFLLPLIEKNNNRRKSRMCMDVYKHSVSEMDGNKKKFCVLQRTTIHAISQFFLKTFWRFLFHVMPFSGCYFLPPWHGKKENETNEGKKVLSWHVPNSRKSLLIIPTFTYNLTIHTLELFLLFSMVFCGNFSKRLVKKMKNAKKFAT